VKYRCADPRLWPSLPALLQQQQSSSFATC
jgi:hypothetical protein